MNINEALAILGKPFSDLSVKGNTAQSSNLVICYRFSKYYEINGVWWTSEYPDRLINCNYIIIGVGGKGILVIPSNVILDYWERFNVGFLSHGLRKIRVKEDNSGDLVLYNNSGQGIINIQQYLRP